MTEGKRPFPFLIQKPHVGLRNACPNTEASPPVPMVLLVSLERLAFLEPEGKVGYRWDRDGEGQETMDYLEYIARMTSHIPDKGQEDLVWS